MFSFAGQPDIVRASQKDEFYLGALKADLEDLASAALGARSVRLGPELNFATSALYYGLTSLRGNRTPGEEYCDIMQVSGRNSISSPSIRRRCTLWCAQTVVPYIAVLIRDRGRRVRNRSLSIAQKSWNAIVNLSGKLESSLGHVLRFHLGLFYLYG
jgi:peroxin-10